MNHIVKPDNHGLGDQSILEVILKLILSNIKGTPENLNKEMEKHKKY